MCIRDCVFVFELKKKLTNGNKFAKLYTYIRSRYTEDKISLLLLLHGWIHGSIPQEVCYDLN